MRINMDEFRDKVRGCWMGKNIGGTLGEPFEWRRQVNDVGFYTQDLNGEPRPNDDLDLQLAWLYAVERHGPRIDAKILAEYWLNYITPNWVEYGNGKANLRAGLLPPLSGWYRNAYRDSCGAYIRSEIWACLLPGAPAAAARLAYEDGIVDHGGGEGVYAEAFCAAIESAAFVIGDTRTLIDIGLSVIPGDCGVARAVRLALDCHANGITWLEARSRILEGVGNFKPGWDVPSNIGIMLVGWLYGDGDFGKSLCIAVNCGEDTDCTAATLGSIMGIIRGISGIPEEWKEPIGNGINTLTLNKADGWPIPRSVDELSDRVVRQAVSATVAYGTPLHICEGAPTDLTGLDTEGWKRPGKLDDLWNRPATAIPFESPTVSAIIDYVDGPEVRSGAPKEMTLTLSRRIPAQQVANVNIHLPEGWTCSIPGSTAVFLYDNQTIPQPDVIFPTGYKALLRFTVTPGLLRESIYRGGIDITIHDRPSVLHVPLVFLNMPEFVEQVQ